MKKGLMRGRHPAVLIGAVAMFVISTTALSDSFGGAYAQTWSYTGSLNTQRYVHTATLLPNGKVLVAGGINECPTNCRANNMAELYDPSTGTWSITGSIHMSRSHHTITLLPTSIVLAAAVTSI